MKGILFKPDMIKAICDKRKMVTRRVVNPQPKTDGIDGYEVESGHYHPVKIGRNGEEYPGDEVYGIYSLDGEHGWAARYQVGETVYIKEAHYRWGRWIKNGFTKTGKQAWSFKSDNHAVSYLDCPPKLLVETNKSRNLPGWYKRTPLFMPAWAARYFIKITDVSAGRVQEISIADALAEGIEHKPFIATTLFQEKWDSINGKGDFALNKWVFRYEFLYLREGKED